MTTLYDPDLAKFGNAVSPFVEMPAADAQWASQLPFDRRYDSRWQTPSDWWLEDSFLVEGPSFVGAGSMNVRHYAPISDGGFRDLIDDLTHAGVSCAMQSENQARCTWHNARFIVVHDPDGAIRVQLTDDGGLGSHAWDLVDSILTQATRGSPGARVGLASGSSGDPLRLDNRALLGAAGIAAVTALLVSQSKKHGLLIGAAGMAGIALSLALSVKKDSFR